MNESAYARVIFIVKNIRKKQTLGCTPFVRQYGILNNKRGALLCHEGSYQTNDTHQNSKIFARNNGGQTSRERYVSETMHDDLRSTDHRRITKRWERMLSDGGTGRL